MSPHSNPLSIAVVGAGLIGRRHLKAIVEAGGRIHSIVDPDAGTRDLAHDLGVPHRTHLADALAQRPDGVILATPNAQHEAGALACIEAGIPVLVEKPIAIDPTAAHRIVEAGKRRDVPVLTGHHRRHSGIIRRAKDMIASGALGKIVSVHVSFWLAKPDAYFETGWRRSEGGGPLMINLIHEIDLLRHLVGDIAEVEAFASNNIRRFEVEDSFVAIVRFRNGALGTIQVSDTIVAPWSWELTAQDNPAYPPTGENALLIGGTMGSLALPRGDMWSDGGKRDWWAPITRTSVPRDFTDPLVRQMENFMAVIRGTEMPVCSGEEGLKSLETLFALRKAGLDGLAAGQAA